MPRPLRIEYAGAIYHVMNRGDRREAIYRDDEDRATFLHTLGEACGKTGWQLHAWYLMGNHFHLMAEGRACNKVFSCHFSPAPVVLLHEKGAMAG